MNQDYVLYLKIDIFKVKVQSTIFSDARDSWAVMMNVTYQGVADRR